MARRIVGLLLGAAFLLALFFATRRETAVQCELCISYDGRTACRTAAAADRDAAVRAAISTACDAAVRAAISTACAALASGVTRGLECDRTPPHSLSCSE
jgi:hypothetical protein